MEAGLPTLRDAVLKHMLSYVGHAWDFLQCERTCNSLCGVMKDDEVWERVKSANPSLRVNKHFGPQRTEKGVCGSSSRTVGSEKNQGQNHSVIRSVMSLEEWQQRSYPSEKNEKSRFDIFS